MRYSYSRDELELATKGNESVSGVLRAMGMAPSGGQHSHIKKLLSKFGIDTSHFTGSAGSGRGAKHSGGPERKTPELILTLKPKGGRYEQTALLRRALFELGRRWECEGCGNSGEWRGVPLTLQIDHVDGNRHDDRVSNLRFLCPNCHSQTETFGNRKRAEVLA
jgi:hypothetical protein